MSHKRIFISANDRETRRKTKKLTTTIRVACKYRVLGNAVRKLNRPHNKLANVSSSGNQPVNHNWIHNLADAAKMMIGNAREVKRNPWHPLQRVMGKLKRKKTGPKRNASEMTCARGFFFFFFLFFFIKHG